MEGFGTGEMAKDIEKDKMHIEGSIQDGDSSAKISIAVDIFCNEHQQGRVHGYPSRVYVEMACQSEKNTYAAF